MGTEQHTKDFTLCILKVALTGRGDESILMDSEVPDNPNAEEIRGLLEYLDNPAIIVVDEFDRVDQITATLMADTIKTISDRTIDATLVIVGVAETLDGLIEEHASVVRALVQVEMKRMSFDESLETIAIKSADGYSVVLRTAKTGVPVSCPLPTDVAKSLLELPSEFPFWTRKSSAEKCASNWRDTHTSSGIQQPPRTAGKRLERLKRFFNWCLENEWITSNPAKPLKSPKVGDTDVIPLTEEQVAKFLKACEQYEGSNRVRLIILTKFMLASALRIGDAVTISKERIQYRRITGMNLAFGAGSQLASSINTG